MVSTTSRPLVQRPSFWGMVAAVLAIVAGAVIVALNSLVYTPQAAVEDFVAALRSGDGPTAMALSQAYLAEDAPDEISTILLDGDGLLAASEMLEHAEIRAVDTAVPDSFHDDELRQRVVEITFPDATGTARTTQLVVDKIDTSWLIFSQWALHPMPLQVVELAPSQMPERAPTDAPVAHVLGQATPLLGDGDAPATLAVFAPSLLELEYEGTYLEVAEPAHLAVTDVLGVGATTSFDFEISLTQAVDDAITGEVQQQLQRCTQQTVLKPAGCPFGYETNNRVVPDSVSWTIDVAEVAYSWKNSEPVIDGITATAQLAAEEINIGSGMRSDVAYEEDFQMTADLTLTPEYLSVSPNWQ